MAISLGHQAGHLAKRNHIFPKRPRFYKCQLFQNILQVTKGSGGSVWGDSFHQHRLFLPPGHPDDLRITPGCKRRGCAWDPVSEAQLSACEGNMRRRPQQRAPRTLQGLYVNLAGKERTLSRREPFPQEAGRSSIQKRRSLKPGSLCLSVHDGTLGK